MKKRLRTHMKWLMLFSLLTSSLYAADNINVITGPESISKGQEVTLTVEYEASQERTIAVYCQSLDPKKMHFYKRFDVNTSATSLSTTFTVPNDVPTTGTFRYKAYIAPKGGKWSSNLGYASQEGVTYEDDAIANDTVKSIKGPASITIGEEVTLTVDYVASEVRTLTAYLKATTGTKEIYFYERITVKAGDELKNITFTVPNNAPTDATYKYGTYIAPLGKYYKDNLGKAYQHGVKVHNIDNPPLSRGELQALVEQWLSIKPIGDIEDRRLPEESEQLKQQIENADVSQITDMSNIFSYCDEYHPMPVGLGTLNLTKWDVSNVTNMKGMFACNNYNPHPQMWSANTIDAKISTWDVSNVKDMSYMFYGTDHKDIDKLNSWDVSNVTNMESMFHNSNFSQSIDNWDVSNVTNMKGMFRRTRYFNHPLNNWDVSNVTTMNSMFHSSRYNHPLDNWDVSNVTDMGFMFASSRGRFAIGAYFNQDISNWNVSNVINYDNFAGNGIEYTSVLEDRYNPFY